jgi:hypothetical protein
MCFAFRQWWLYLKKQLLNALVIHFNHISPEKAQGGRLPGYGSSGPFRQALSERGLLWAVGMSRRQNVYPADIALILPIAKTGKPRKYHIPYRPPVSAEALLAEGKGSAGGGAPVTVFSAVSVVLPYGAPRGESQCLN